MVTIADRQLIIKVGLPGGVAQQWSDLYCEAEVESTRGKTPNTAKVQIYNLSPTSLQFLKQKNLALQVLAGSGVPSSLFAGDIDARSIKTKRQGPEQITEMTAKDGGAVIRSALFVGSYPPGTTRTQILTDVLAQANLSLGYIDPTITERTYPGPVAWAAPVRDVLSELYAPEGALWSVQNNVLQVMALGLPGPQPALSVTAGTGLMGSPTVTDKGVDMRIVLNPAVVPGTIISLKSSILSGGFIATKIMHKATWTGQTWETGIQAVPR
jgi:hypothetical protein